MGTNQFSFLLLATALLIATLNHMAQAFQIPSCNMIGKSTTRRQMSTLNTSFGADLQQSESAKALDWSFIDGVYLITCPNADTDGSRIREAKNILGDSGLLDRLEVKEFQTDDENRIRGCYTSHISVLKDILDDLGSSSRNARPFDDLFAIFNNKPNQVLEEGKKDDDFIALVIEDNLALSGGDIQQSKINAVEEFCQNDGAWDMIHLSYIPYVPDLKVSRTSKKDIVKLSTGSEQSALGTTAYLINSNAVRTILNHHEEKGGFYAPIPDVMAELFPESRYAINPTFFVRAPKTSSLVNPQLDDLRSLLFQPAVAAFAQNLLVMTGLSTTALLPIVILLLLGATAASSVITFNSMWSLVTTGDMGVPIVLPLVSSLFSIFSLAIIAQGVILAPKPTDDS